MNPSEQADFSAEHTDEPNLLDVLTAERNTVGSTRKYLHALGVYHESVPEHRANMLQLQRMAILVTNPTNEPSFPKRFTDAFYWGEILAYTSQDRSESEGWADASYKLFNMLMVEMLRELRDVDLSSYAENLWQISATTIGLVEVADEEVMPPAMDQLIIEWSKEITDDPEEQNYIVFGFRHIIMQIVYFAQQASEDENSIEDVRRGAKTANDFLELMHENDVDDVSWAETEPINDVPGRIMESYHEHRRAYGFYDVDNEDEVDTVGLYLTQAVNRDFVDMEGIESDDLIRVGGDAVAMIYDTIEEERPPTVYMLTKDEFFEGTAEGVAIMETPSQQAIVRLQEHIIELDELEYEGTEQLGALLMLKDPVLISPEGTYIPLDNKLVCIVLDNPNMHMAKYLL